MAEAAGRGGPFAFPELVLLNAFFRDLSQKLVDEVPLLLFGQRGLDQPASSPYGQVRRHHADLAQRGTLLRLKPLQTLIHDPLGFGPGSR